MFPWFSRIEATKLNQLEFFICLVSEISCIYIQIFWSTLLFEGVGRNSSTIGNRYRMNMKGVAISWDRACRTKEEAIEPFSPFMVSGDILLDLFFLVYRHFHDCGPNKGATKDTKDTIPLSTLGSLRPPSFYILSNLYLISKILCRV